MRIVKMATGNRFGRRAMPAPILMIAPILVIAASALSVPVAAAETTPPSDYARSESWLCLPGREDACTQDLTATIVQADGSTSIEAFKAEAEPPIDCFYVYPTVSIAPGPNSPMQPSANETGIALHQAARFRSVCRVFAPMYRQVTASFALTSPPPGPEAIARARTIAYEDVRAAWHEYLKTYNHGRGFVLIGHSQGSGHLARLIHDEIDGLPISRRMVSALLTGTDVAVPKGGDVGGDFKASPLCRSTGQTGCVVAFASFRDRLPPTGGARFGRPRSHGADSSGAPFVSACVNPAALAGGDGELKSYLGAQTPVAGFKPQPFAWADGVDVKTTFVALPGLLHAHCASRRGYDYLEVGVNADLDDPRANDITGDFIVDGRILYDWGLHIIDVNLTMGNLIDLVKTQRTAWLAGARGMGK